MNEKTFYEFVHAINDHDVEKIYSLMTDDHIFIDAHGNEVNGKNKMKAGWAGYFQWFPDYIIEITDILTIGDNLAAFGFASGTFKGIITDKNENYWRLPAAWKVIVSQNKIKLWQVYADTKIPFDIIGKNNKSGNAEPVISAMLAVADAPTAVVWYKKALGATELWNFGSVVGLKIGSAVFFLGEPANNGWESPASLGITSARVEVFSDDPDSFITCAVQAGANGSFDNIKNHETPWGIHRQGGFIDPFGHIWLVGDKSPLKTFP